jgi:hypothetical protein
MRKRGIKRILLVSISAVFVCSCFASAASGQSQQSEIEQLKNIVRTMQDTITKLNQKVIVLEQKQEKTAVDQAEMEEKIVDVAEKATPMYTLPEIPAGHMSPVPYENAFQDRQMAAPRLDDYTMDPEFNGFIPIPNTSVLVKFNARPRLDITWDNREPGDEDRFVTAKIPLRGMSNYRSNNNFNMNSRASSLSFEARAPGRPGDPRFYYENDFFGSGDNEYEYRIKHLYAKVYNFVIGHTYSVFEDPDIWPDTVDFEGPNSMIFARFPVLHYMHQLSDEWLLKFGIEQPDNLPSVFQRGEYEEDVDDINSWPDGGFNIRWVRKGVGHMQFATILRSVGADSELFGDDETFGWGTNLSSSFNIFDGDIVKTQLTYGEGIGRYGNDSSFSRTDAAFDKNGNLKVLPYFGAFFGYTHKWNEKWRSTATYGYVHLGHERTQQPDDYKATHYSSMNLIWQIYKKMSIGFEGLYGHREVISGEDGSLFRLQTGIHYSLF